MIRAIFFDFYSVWLPDPFTQYLDMARQRDPIVAREVESAMGQYYQGKIDPISLAKTFRDQLNLADMKDGHFLLKESDISPAVTDFMRELHGHFVKLGILASLGAQEYQLLNEFNTHNQVFEVITGPLPLGLSVTLLSQEVFAGALQQIGEPPDSCLIVTGNPIYQHYAEGLGIQALAFEGMPKLKQTLEQLLMSDVPQTEN